MITIATDRRVVPRITREQGVVLFEMPRLWGSSLFFNGTRMPLDLAVRSVMQIVSRYDVVHAFTHHLNAFLPALVGRWIGRSALFIGDRDDLWTEGGLAGDGRGVGFLRRTDYKFQALTERRLGRWLGAITVVSEDLRARELAGGMNPGRVRKIINGCPIDQITPGDKAQTRAALGLAPDRRILLFVGVGQYDVELIMEALVRFRSIGSGLEMPLTLLVGPHGEALNAMARKHGLENMVHATDFVPDQKVLQYLQAADLALLPFADKPLNWARWPIKLGDYLAAGLPVLTNAIGEMGRVVQEERVGEATAPNPQAYAEGLCRLLLMEPVQLRELGRHARGIAERMSWDSVGGELESFYRELGAP
jgi:glycosyltransferase involved in cell wall biosynthesis